ncbi:MAG: hypothetical protein NTW19_18560 [Planctomycetota bacterium]|nr:hypothetical protein [Planctomycetota bacterium]
MKRRLLIALAIVSLALCLATSVEWVRSIWGTDAVVVAKDWLNPAAPLGAIALVQFNQGVAWFFVGHSHHVPGADSHEDAEAAGWHFMAARGAPTAGSPLTKLHWCLGFAGSFEYESDAAEKAFMLESEFVVPYWFMVGSFALVAVAIMLYVRHRYRPRGEHECLACGYDLRGSTGACPECGAARPTAAVSLAATAAAPHQTG